MGYFDSPKNRAMWKIEVERLEQVKQDRKNGYVPVAGVQTAAHEEEKKNPDRVRVSYKELLKEEQEGKKDRLRRRQAAMLDKERERSKDELQR